MSADTKTNKVPGGSGAKAGGMAEVWSGLPLRGKIVSAIGAVLTIFLIASGISAVNFFRVSHDVDLYTSAVTEAAIAARIEAGFLKYNGHAREFARTYSETEAAAIEELAPVIRQRIEDALTVIQAPEHVKRLNEIKEVFEAFDHEFDEVRALMADQRHLVEDMLGSGGVGDKLAHDLEIIIHELELEGQNNAVINRAIEAHDEARRAQLYSSRTFGIRDESYGPKTLETLDALEEHLKELRPMLRTAGEIAALEESVELTAKFREEFTAAAHESERLHELLDVKMIEQAGTIIRDTEWLEAATAEEEHHAEEETRSIIAQSEILVIAITLGGLVVGGALGLYIGNSISGPINSMTTAMLRLADSDWSTEVPAKERRDEIGQMADAVQTFKDNGIEAERLRAEQVEQERRAEEARKKQEEAERRAEQEKIERERQAEEEKAERTRQAAIERRNLMNTMADDFERSVGGVVETVAAAATELQASAETMTTAAEQTSNQASTVAAASEEASVNVQGVSSATEELSASISEISAQVARSSAASRSAVGEVDGATAQVQGLADAAQKIGEVSHDHGHC